MVVKAKINQKSIDDVINKGADVIEDQVKKESNDWTLISVRLPKDLLKKIDQERSQSIGLTRNAWILQQFQKAISH